MLGSLSRGLLRSVGSTLSVWIIVVVELLAGLTICVLVAALVVWAVGLLVLHWAVIGCIVFWRGCNSKLFCGRWDGQTGPVGRKARIGKQQLCGFKAKNEARTQILQLPHEKGKLLQVCPAKCDKNTVARFQPTREPCRI